MKSKYVVENIEEYLPYLTTSSREFERAANFSIPKPENGGLCITNKPSDLVKNKITISLSDRNVVINRWIQVGSRKVVLFTGFHMVVHFPAIPAAYKNVTVQSSADGVNFVDLESFTLGVVEDQTVMLTSPFEAQHFRLYVYHDGKGRYLKINDLEIYH